MPSSITTVPTATRRVAGASSGWCGDGTCGGGWPWSRLITPLLKPCRRPPLRLSESKLVKITTPHRSVGIEGHVGVEVGVGAVMAHHRHAVHRPGFPAHAVEDVPGPLPDRGCMHGGNPVRSREPTCPAYRPPLSCTLRK